jgi:hypothetical protein
MDLSIVPLFELLARIVDLIKFFESNQVISKCAPKKALFVIGIIPEPKSLFEQPVRRAFAALSFNEISVEGHDRRLSFEIATICRKILCSLDFCSTFYQEKVECTTFPFDIRSKTSGNRLRSCFFQPMPIIKLTSTSLSPL